MWILLCCTLTKIESDTPEEHAALKQGEVPRVWKERSSASWRRLPDTDTIPIIVKPNPESPD